MTMRFRDVTRRHESVDSVGPPHADGRRKAYAFLLPLAAGKPGQSWPSGARRDYMTKDDVLDRR
jgi:hypothetical protein